MDLHYWFMFPIAIGISTIAMASGVEGATFFTPLFMVALGLPPNVAIGTGLITEVFGFSSGVYAYTRQKLIDYQLGRTLLLVTIPTALLGTWLAKAIPAELLKGILGVGLLAIATSFFKPSPEAINPQCSAPGEMDRSLTAASGEVFSYRLRQVKEGQILAGLGALFLGMISTGLGQMNGYFLIRRCCLPSQVAVATSVFTVAITALIASVGHVVQLIQAGQQTWSLVLSLVSFTVPGVLIGAQLGSLLAIRLPQKVLERGMGLLFVLVGVIILGEIAGQHRLAIANVLRYFA